MYLYCSIAICRGVKGRIHTVYCEVLARAYYRIMMHMVLLYARVQLCMWFMRYFFTKQYSKCVA